MLGISQSSKRALRNPWVLAWLSIVVVVVTVNVFMISMAVRTNPGLVESDYYERGRDHERNVISRHDARVALGWTARLEISEMRQNSQMPVRLVLADRIGMPVTGIAPTLHLYRASDSSQDQRHTMVEIHPGIYESRPVVPLKGFWELNFTAERGEDLFEMNRRIHVAGE
jgi:nitrogen fixation protein FixH